MKINVVEKYGAVVLEFKGDLMGGPFASEMNELLHKLLTENKKNVVIDMKDVKYVNSSGIGILISGYTTMKNGGGDLKLAQLSDKVQGVLAITKLNKVFEQFKTLDEAVKSF